MECLGRDTYELFLRLKAQWPIAAVEDCKPRSPAGFSLPEAAHHIPALVGSAMAVLGPSVNGPENQVKFICKIISFLPFNNLLKAAKMEKYNVRFYFM